MTNTKTNNKVLGWAEFSQGNPCNQALLIEWKLAQFRNVGWGGTNIEKWGGTASICRDISDEVIPLGCLTLLNDETIGGMGFIIENDLPNYPVDGELSSAIFTGEVAPDGEIANPWLAGLIVDEKFRSKKNQPSEDRLNLGRRQEQWLIQKATELANAALWPYSRRRLWLFTEREPLDFLPEMYERWGWKHHRQIEYKGVQSWVMYKDF